MEEIVEILDKVIKMKNGKLICIVVDMIKGKGVFYMENICLWYGVVLNEKEYE